MGCQSEIEAAPSIAMFYPNQKRIYTDSNNQQFGQSHLGFINKHDGHDQSVTGGCLVFVYEYEFISEEAGPKVVAIVKKLQAQMKKNKELGPHNISMLKFWHTSDRKGYKCIQICRSAKLYDANAISIGQSKAGQEAVALAELVNMKYARVYGSYGEITASEYLLPMMGDTIDIVYGTPIVEAFGKPMHGWCD